MREQALDQRGIKDSIPHQRHLVAIDLCPSFLDKRLPDIGVLQQEVESEKLIVERDVYTHALQHLEQRGNPQVLVRITESPFNRESTFFKTTKVRSLACGVHIDPTRHLGGSRKIGHTGKSPAPHVVPDNPMVSVSRERPSHVFLEQILA